MASSVLLICIPSSMMSAIKRAGKCTGMFRKYASRGDTCPNLLTKGSPTYLLFGPRARSIFGPKSIDFDICLRPQKRYLKMEPFWGPFWGPFFWTLISKPGSIQCIRVRLCLTFGTPRSLTTVSKKLSQKGTSNGPPNGPFWDPKSGYQNGPIF